MYQQNISYEDFSNICRFCLATKSATTILNQLYDDNNMELTKKLGEMIYDCLGIKVSRICF